MLILRRFAVTQTHLAETAGVNRSTVDQIVQGRVRSINAGVLNALTTISLIPQTDIQKQVDAWFERPSNIEFSPRLRAVMALSPDELHRYYRSFSTWRAEFSSNPTAFASMLHINRLTVKRYEDGQFKGGMPSTLHTALIRHLGLSDEYVLALGRLPEQG